jgi:hypothetical protein
MARKRSSNFGTTSNMGGSASGKTVSVKTSVVQLKPRGYKQTGRK